MTPMNENQEREDVELILPAGMLAELQARADKRACTPEQLIDEADERTMVRSPHSVHAFLLRVQAIDDALSAGQRPPWPDNFDECLEVGLALSRLIKCTSEEYLLEASGAEMDIFDDFCRRTGKSDEEIVRETLDAALAKENREASGNEDDQDDWWKGD
jgi:hypothetical protein